MLRVILALWWGLVIYWLLGAGLKAQSQADPSQQRSAAVAPFDWPRQVQGFGLDTASARKDALQQAQKALGDFLRHHHLACFQPTLAYLEASLIEGPGQQGPEIPLEKLGVAKTWIFQLKNPNLAELRRLDRLVEKQREQELHQARTEERLWLLRWLLAAVVVLLAGVFGYIRLDEWTHGRYTRWWRK